MEGITTLKRPIETVKLEVRSMNNLIERRENWLADPVNRKKRTYEVVKKDTAEMVATYKELVNELNELNKNQQP